MAGSSSGLVYMQISKYLFLNVRWTWCGSVPSCSAFLWACLTVLWSLWQTHLTVNIQDMYVWVWCPLKLKGMWFFLALCIFQKWHSQTWWAVLPGLLMIWFFFFWSVISYVQQVETLAYSFRLGGLHDQRSSPWFFGRNCCTDSHHLLHVMFDSGPVFLPWVFICWTHWFASCSISRINMQSTDGLLFCLRSSIWHICQCWRRLMPVQCFAQSL